MAQIWGRVVGSAVAVLVLAALGFAAWRLWPRSIVPKHIGQQVTSTILLPKSDQALVDPRSFKYNDKEKVMSYTARYAGQTLTISEQPVPDSFSDIPEVYKKVVEQMNNYETFESRNGTVYLTTPTNLRGLQTAVLNAKGTLTFIKPSSNLSSDQWKRFFNTFKDE